MQEEEVQFLKQQAEREKEELLKMVSSRDEDHKKLLESVKKVSYSIIVIQHTSSSCPSYSYTKRRNRMSSNT